MDVVLQNLEIAFPEKNLSERKKIARQFYRNLIDTFMETIKMLSASDAFLQKRVTGNWELINEWHASGRAVHVHMGHTFNWEWGNYIAGKKLLFKFLGVYMPVKNQSLDRLFKSIRSRSGTVLIPATPTKLFTAAFHPFRDSQYLLGLAADQSPGDASRAFWLNFFGKKTAFVTGPEKGAMRNNNAVVFVKFIKIKRGYYFYENHLVTENAAECKPGELTRKFRDFTEDAITEAPAGFLWSHRRWRHEYKDDFRKMWIDE